MDVAAYIKELLYQERVVHVPGLGTFLMRKSAGFYNDEQQRFYPPKNSIDFVEEEKQDDALENYISGKKNISTTAARYFIDKYVEQLKLDAATKNIPVKEVLFPAEEKGNVENEVSVPVYNMENFGLPPISLPYNKKINETEKKEPVPKENYVENFYHEFTSNLPEKETELKRNTSFWVSVFLLLAVALLGCYTMYLYYPDLLSRFNERKPVAQTVSHPVDTIGKKTSLQLQPKTDTSTTKTTIDSPKTEAAVAVKTVTPAAKTPIKDTIATAETTTTADPDLVAKSPYEIIGASFKTLNGAKAFLAQLKSKGMRRAKILGNTAGKQKLVTFGSFTDKETASAALKKLHAKDPQSEAYIQHYIIK